MAERSSGGGRIRASNIVIANTIVSFASKSAGIQPGSSEDPAPIAPKTHYGAGNWGQKPESGCSYRSEVPGAGSPSGAV